jgi:O-antigen ligase
MSKNSLIEFKPSLDAARLNTETAVSRGSHHFPPWRSWMLVLVGVITPISLYIPQTTGVPPISSLLVSAVVLLSIWTHATPTTIAVSALSLASSSLLALTWSPVQETGYTTIIYFLQLAGLLAIGPNIPLRSPTIFRMLYAWAAIALLDAVLVLVFRAVPQAEIAWFQTKIAEYLIGQGTVKGLFAGSPNNALDPAKAGAFFVNANAGSAFLGVAHLVSVYLFCETRQRRWLLAAAVFAIAVLASGSASGALLLVFFQSLAALRWLRKTMLRSALIPPFLLCLGYLVYVLWTALESDAGVLSRGVLWGAAVDAIQSSPLTGLGFGGWDIYAGSLFASVGASSYPPHNLLLNYWIQAGVLGAVALLGFFLVMMSSLGRSHAANRFPVVAAVLWTLVYSMGDNTTIFNDLHTMPVLAVLVGSMCGVRNDKTDSHLQARPVQAIGNIYHPAG